MFRSPPQLRSGSKGKAVALSTSDRKPVLQRSLSTSSASSPVNTTTMPADKTTQLLDPALDIIGKLVSRMSEEIRTVVEVAVRAALTAVNEEVKKLRDEVTNLTAVVTELDSRLAERTDDLEQYQRRDNLRIFGIEETVGEDTDKLVEELYRDKLGVELPPESISRSHRGSSHTTWTEEYLDPGRESSVGRPTRQQRRSDKIGRLDLGAASHQR
ncbi:hypothetical protein J6590_061300 [Homalodisca vitripennis]|nr:hypothetical protein J6590_061300 [Homalodisca vitripennis]